MSFLFGQKENPSTLKSLISSIQKSPTSQKYLSLSQYIPQDSEVILESLLNNMISTLTSPGDQSTQKSIIDIIYEMIKVSEDQRLDTEVYIILIRQVNFIDALLRHITPLNPRLIYIVKMIFMRFPKYVIDYMVVHINCAEEMIDLISTTKDFETSHLFQIMSVSRDDLWQELYPLISKRIVEFPVSTFVDYLIASENSTIYHFKDLIPDDQIEGWLLQHDSFQISDAEELVKNYPLLWNTESFLLILSRTLPVADTIAVNWIHHYGPHNTPLHLSKENALPIQDSLIDPKVDFSVVVTNDHNDEQHILTDQCESYAFLRLFCLSFADPSDLDPKAIEEVCDLCTNKREYIAAAATQTIMTWILNYHLKIDVSLAYKCAGGIFEEDRSTGNIVLYKALLMTVGTLFDTVVSLLASSAELVYNDSDKNEILNSKWCFPDFYKTLNLVLELKLVDYSEAQKPLGFILSALGVVDDDNTILSE